MTRISLRDAVPDDVDALFAIWHDAVRATHDFLTEEDMAFFATLVREQYLPYAPLMVASDGKDRPVAFMGLSENKIDSLFVGPAWHGKGIGRHLVGHAKEGRDVLYVDVNEQNSGARRFYTALGFTEYGRSPVDDSGRPYPITHLVYRAPK